jgi:UDP-glucose 4-epimerase
LSTYGLAIVTGAHGFVGRHVARKLGRKGYTVFGIGHGRWSREEWAQWGMTEWLSADITVKNLHRFNHLPQLVVHCAGSGSVSFSQQNPALDFERTVTSTIQVLEYLRTAAPGAALVYPSSASVYGNSTASPIHEMTALAPVSQYGIHKLIAEQMIRSWSQRYAIPSAIVRLFSTYGPGLRKQLLWDACGKLAVGDTLFMGTGDEVRDWLHVEDAAELLMLAADHAQVSCPTINGGSGEGVKVRVLLECLAEALLGQHTTVSFSNLQRMGDPSAYVADITSACRLSWRPERPWRSGVAEYVAWWSREHQSEAADQDNSGGGQGALNPMPTVKPTFRLGATLSETTLLKGTTMPPTQDVGVGFIVHNGIWLGGLNYLSNLLAGVRLLPETRLTPILLTGTGTDCMEQRFEGTRILRTPLLDRRSLPWAARKAASTLLANDRLLQQFMDRHDISVLSHSGHLGRRGTTPSIGWIPDLQHLRLPRFFTPKQIADRNRSCQEICDCCTRVVVSSHCSLEDLHRFAPASRHKADVLSFVAMPPQLDPQHSLAEMQSTYQFQTPYFLLPNQFWAHKNHHVVIRALQQLKARNQSVLVLSTGETRDLRNPTYFSDLMRIAEDACVLDCFRVLGTIPSRHLAVLMHHAIGFINPSLFEGWSTSVEEAKSMGRRIILSDIPVHREQAPQRGVFFHPDDADGLASILDVARREYEPASEQQCLQEARLQLPTRLKAFALQYSQIVGKTLAPELLEPGWLQAFTSKARV